MSERNKPHNGRDVHGHFEVRAVDVDDLVADPEGPDHLRDDVRLGGAVADTGPEAGLRARHITELVLENREDVSRTTNKKP